MTLRFSFLFCSAVLASGALAQNSPADVTDAQVRKYKAAAEEGCIESGKQRGDPQAQVSQFCKCMTGVFEKGLTASEWKQAVYFHLQNRAAEESNVFGPHAAKLRTCNPPEPAAAAPAPAKPAAKK